MKEENVTLAPENSPADIKALSHTLLQIGTHLMGAGANCHRIIKTLNRIAGEFDCTMELNISPSVLTLSLHHDGRDYTKMMRSHPPGVNFKVVSGFSRMSWRVVRENWSLAQIQADVDRILALPHYPRLLVLVVVSIAGASFCRLFGGEWLDMVIAFIATFAGLFVRQEAMKRHVNTYASVFLAALTSTLVTTLFLKFNISVNDQVLSASVLYLIPGVPLINSFSDLLNNNIMIGIVRNVNSLIVAFAIAFGLLLAIYISMAL